MLACASARCLSVSCFLFSSFDLRVPVQEPVSCRLVKLEDRSVEHKRDVLHISTLESLGDLPRNPLFFEGVIVSSLGSSVR